MPPDVVLQPLLVIEELSLGEHLVEYEAFNEPDFAAKEPSDVGGAGFARTKAGNRRPSQHSLRSPEGLAGPLPRHRLLRTVSLLEGKHPPAGEQVAKVLTEQPATR